MRLTRSKSLLLFRIISAAVLTLALLSSVVPTSVWSAGHSCSMPCCAGGSCATGACDGGALFQKPKQEKEKDEKLCGAKEEGHQTHAAPKASSAAHHSPDASAESHCGREEKASPTTARTAATQTKQSPTATLSATALVAPCPKDCCAVAASSVQSRRGRDDGDPAENIHAPPAALVTFSQYAKDAPPVSRVPLKRLRPRGPPAPSNNPV